jgi:mannose-6-phosphate isomerase-like protein (cupin superfamily)
VIWNHITRYHGGNLRRTITQATPQSMVISPSSASRTRWPYRPCWGLQTGQRGERAQLFQTGGDRTGAAGGQCVAGSRDPRSGQEPRKAWIYNAGQRRVRRAPQVAYDGVGTSSDGLRTTDNFDMFSGAPDRYDWKLIGKKEMYIPYNSYKLDSPDLKYTDVIKAGHINQDLTRYELHRVWEVVATVKPNERHVYAKRHMYIDEDTWQVALADHYDGRDQLWRVAEGHAQFYYDHQFRPTLSRRCMTSSPAVTSHWG